MARVGRLFVDLLARTASFESGLDKSRRKSRKFSKGVTADLKKVGIGFAALGAAAAVGLGVLVKKSIDAADNLSKLAQKTGISVESLSGLAFAADQSGIDLETLSARMVNLARRAKEGDRGVLSYRQAFDKLGISLRDNNGQLKGTEELLLEVADSFSQMEDGTLKAALATDLFSNQGVALIPFLNQGAAGIRKMKDEAAELGLIMDTETALGAERFNDNLGKLQGALTGIGNTILAETAPMMVLLSDSMVDFVKEGDGAKKLAQGIASAFKQIAIFVSATTTTMQIALIGVGTPIQAFLELLRAPFTGTLAGVTAVLAQARIEMEKIAETGALQLVRLSEGLTKVGEAAETAGGEGKGGGGLSTFANAGQKIIDRLKQQNLQLALGSLGWLQYQAAQAGAGSAALATIEQQFRVGEALRLAQAGMQEQAETITVDLGPAVLELDQKTAALAEQNRRLLGTFQDLDKSGIDLSRTVGEGTEGFRAMKDAGQLMQSGFDGMFDDAISGGKNLTKLLQGIIKELAKIIIKLVIIKILGFFGIPGFEKGGEIKGLQTGGRALVGEPVVVGERGRELFIPDVAGEILPNEVFRGAQTALRAALGFEPAGGEPQIVNNFNIQIEGLISGDRLDEVIAKIAQRIKFNDAQMPASFLL